VFTYALGLKEGGSGRTHVHPLLGSTTADLAGRQPLKFLLSRQRCENRG